MLLPCCPVGPCLPAVQWEQRHFGRLIPLPLPSLEQFCLPQAAFPDGRRWHYEHYTGEAFLLESVHCSRTEFPFPAMGLTCGDLQHTQEGAGEDSFSHCWPDRAPHQNKRGVRRVNTHCNKRLLLLWAPEVSCDLTHPTPHSVRRLCITAGARGREGYRGFPSVPAPSGPSHRRR